MRRGVASACKNIRRLNATDTRRTEKFPLSLNWDGLTEYNTLLTHAGRHADLIGTYLHTLTGIIRVWRSI